MKIGVLLLVCCALSHAQQDDGPGGGGFNMDDIPPEDMEKIQQMLAQQQGGGDGMDFGGGMGGMDFGGMMGGGPPGIQYEGVREDVKFVLCDTCKAMVDRGLVIAKKIRDSMPNTKISEDRIDEAMEEICDHKSEAGSWMEAFDMVENGDRIDLVKQDGPGKCKTECKTIEMACKKVVEEVGPDMVEQVYLNKKTPDQIKDLICGKGMKRFKGACGKKYPPIPASREAGGDNFEMKSEDDIAMDELNRQIRSSKMGSFNLKDEL